MRFILYDKPIEALIDDKKCEVSGVFQLRPEVKFMAAFVDKNMAGDYVDFLNDKYCDKEINQEWPPINKKERIRYHLEQIELLKSDKPLRWNEHGNGVEGD